ncbi:MAG TPA: citrate transporter [Usitatibacter sp.]|nr:citrate transporter [Usitatibacter sp.]
MHASPVMLGPVPVDFLLFGAILAGIAFYQQHSFRVAVGGLAVIVLYKILVTGFNYGTGIGGFVGVLAHEWVVLANLFLLLMGFALLSKHFEDSHLPLELPRVLPNDWKGAFILLVMVFVLSSFLDNIAAALIGGAMASGVFRRKVHIGYLAAIVAASNGGGAGSVVGDTTTTMMWISGVNPLDVLEGFIASGTALVIFGIFAARQQQAYSPIIKDMPRGTRLDWARVSIVAFILIVAIVANVIANVKFPDLLDQLPVIGLGVWAAILVTAPLRKPDWSLLGPTLKGTIFLLSLVLAASMMPVDKLPSASWPTALGLGFLSAVFDNIPLTALALHQGGYDWGFLAYAVGFGGSMIWFGSSAGVALSNTFPEAKSVGLWLRNGWHIAIAYIVGFFVLLFAHGWEPHAQHTKTSIPSVVTAPQPGSTPGASKNQGSH